MSTGVFLFVFSNTKPAEPIRSLSDNSPATFESGASVTKTTDPIVKAALAHLGTIWPKCISFGRLAAIASSLIVDQPSIVDTTDASTEADRLAKSLLRCYATGHVELSVEPADYMSTTNERAKATNLIRALAGAHGLLISHQSGELVSEVDVRRSIANEVINSSLDKFAKMALLPVSS